MTKKESLAIKTKLLGIAALIMNVKDYQSIEAQIDQNRPHFEQNSVSGQDYIRITRVLKRARRDLLIIEADIASKRHQKTKAAG